MVRRAAAVVNAVELTKNSSKTITLLGVLTPLKAHSQGKKVMSLLLSPLPALRHFFDGNFGKLQNKKHGHTD